MGTAEESKKLDDKFSKYNREWKNLKSEQTKLKNAQREASKAKKLQEKRVRQMTHENEELRARVEAREAELEAQQNQLLRDSEEGMGGDHYAQLVAARKMIQKLQSNPTLEKKLRKLQNQEEQVLKEQLKNLERDRRSHDQEKLIYERFRENDQMEIQAMCEELQDKIREAEKTQAEIDMLKLNAEEEKARALFEQEQYMKQRVKHLALTQELEHDLKKLNVQILLDYEASMMLESRGDKIEEMRKQVKAEREFMKQQNEKLKQSIVDIQNRESSLRQKLSEMEVEKEELKKKNVRYEAKMMELQSKEKKGRRNSKRAPLSPGSKTRSPRASWSRVKKSNSRTEVVETSMQEVEELSEKTQRKSI